MIREFLLSLKEWLLGLNLFKKSSSNEQTLAKELLTTRIFLISFLCLLTLIGIISSLILYTVNKSESSPHVKRFEYLVSKYPKTLNCPCSKAGVTYSTFVTINAEFHQVCSSEFITKLWIETVFAQKNSDGIHRILSFFWQTIADFCAISKQSLNAAIINFNSSFILTPIVNSKDVIENQVYLDLNVYIQAIKTKLAQYLLVIQRTIAGNQYVSAVTSNFYFISLTGEHSLRMSPKELNNCSCMRSTGCPHPAMINQTIVPGMIMDCYLVDATLSSTLECYHNQTCFSLLHPSMPMKLLSNNVNKQFSLNSTIQLLLEKLMIDNLTININFDLFYDQCKPLFCSYSYSHRFDVMFVITTLIISFGVLSFILPLISRLIVMIILRCKGVNSTRAGSFRVKEIIMNIRRSIYTNIINVNLFENERMIDEKYVYEQRFTTRIFLSFFIIFFIIISIVIILSKQEQLITISQPMEEEYQILNEKYSSTLICSCSRISIPYGTFLDVTFLLHQICSSNLVSIQWTNYLSSLNPMNISEWFFEYIAKDFRDVGSSYFEFLQIFCQLANLTIENSQQTFLSTEFISNNLLSPDIFQEKTTDLMDTFIHTIQNTFLEIYQWLRIINTINTFITGTKSNFDGDIENDQVILTDPRRSATVFLRNNEITGAGLCICSTMGNICPIGLILFKNTSKSVNRPYFFQEVSYGCLPWKGFMRSKIDWWYNQSYISDIQDTYATVIPKLFSPIITALDRSINSSFHGKNMEYLIENMFIETIVKKNVNFSTFYNQCAPRSCSYTIIQRREISVLLLLLISISQGLDQILRLFVPLFSHLILFFLLKFISSNRTVVQTTSFQRFKRLLKCIQYFNLFSSDKTDKISLHLQLIYTRVYIVLFIIALGTLVFYNSVIERTRSIITSNPKITDYEQLLQLYSDNVNCPCTQIAIPYAKIVTTLNVTSFHQVCTSSLLGKMIETGRPLGSTTGPSGLEFDSWRKLFMSGISILCALSKNYVKNNIEIFLSSTMLAYQIIPRNVFNQQINITVSHFQNELPIRFNQTLELIRAINHDNALIGIFPSNWNIFVADNNISFVTDPVIYNFTNTNTTCSCATERSCSMPVVIYDFGRRVYVNSPEGVVYSCSLVEAILHSSLFCFYSKTCVLQYRKLANILPLSSEWSDLITKNIFNSSLTRFAINDTIETMVSSMFIESWSSNTSYENFFETCSPSQCIGTYHYRFDTMAIFTTILSVYAGLTFILRFLVPYLIRIINKIRHCNRVQTINTS
ncbi:unnamed protein product [Adineta ricciae]|uniref:Uncharacterized protein n=1 Tax=Adineta ricciae TaxID=249248 RepID=A0A816C5K6_ADIRI|nr:unnamed protein product [Adineta ricciae]